MGKHLFGYIRPHIPMIAVILLLHVLGVYIQLGLINITMPMVDYGVKKNDVDMVIRYGLIMIGAVAVFAVDRLAVAFLSSRITGKMIGAIRRDVYSSLLSADETGRNTMADGRIMTTVTTDISATEDYLMAILNLHSFIPILMIGLLICTATIDIRFGAVMFAVFAVVSIAVYIRGKRMLPAYLNQQENLDRVTDVLKENISGVRTIRAEGKVDQQIEKFDEVNANYGKSNRVVNLSTHYLQPLTTMLMNATVVLAFVAFTLESNQVFMGTGKLLVLFQYVTYFILCVSIIPFLCVIIPRMVPLRRRMSEILTMSEGHDDQERTESPDHDSETVVEIVGADISRGVDSRTVGLDLRIDKGELVAIVGDNVSGKDCIPAAIMGFAKVSAGTIELGGTDIRKIRRKELRSFVSYVADRAQLFRDTYRNNIDPYGTCDSERMDLALDTSRFREVVDESPEGMDTVVTNDGNSISGGQRQKLVIARCIAKRSDLYIFDRCFYSLDTESKNAVISGIRDAVRGSTAMVITSNVHLVRGFDRIFVMENGKVVASGNDESLQRSCDAYRRLLEEDY